MNNAYDSPFADILCGAVFIGIGVLMLIYRDEIGAFTGYYVGRGGWVDKPTPGWMLIPFALVLIAIGTMVILGMYSDTKPTYIPQHSRPQFRSIPPDLMR